MGSIPIFGLNYEYNFYKIMASKKPFIKLQCSDCKRINYFVRKSKGKLGKGEQKLELKKFCNWCRKSTKHKEGKK
ncbi:MAG: 50S ribosomal protein L33 [Patescibacteria group bacterium]